MSTAPDVGPLAGWRLSSDELRKKAGTLRDICLHVDRRASEARRHASAVADATKRLPSRLWSEDAGTSALWEAVYESQSVQARKYVEFAESLCSEHRRLCSLADTIEDLCIENQKRADELLAQHAAKRAAYAEERVRWEAALSDFEAATASANAATNAKKKPKLQEEAAAAEARVAESETRCTALQAELKKFEDECTAVHEPKLVSECWEAVEKRAAALKEILQAIGKCELSLASAMSFSVICVNAASAASQQESSSQDDPRERIKSPVGRCIGGSPLLLPARPTSVPHTWTASRVPSPLLVSHAASGSCGGGGASAPSSPVPPPPLMLNPTVAYRGRMCVTMRPRRCNRIAVGPPPTDAAPAASCPALAVIKQLAERVVELGGLRVEGIFRVSPRKTDLEAALSDLEQHKLPDSAIVAAAVLKRWLQLKLTDPVIPPAQYEEAILKEKDPVEVLKSVPQPGRAILEYLTGFLATVARPENEEHTRMGAAALATVFAPCLLRTPDDVLMSKADAFVYAQRGCQFVMALIRNAAECSEASEPAPIQASKSFTEGLSPVVSIELSPAAESAESASRDESKENSDANNSGGSSSSSGRADDNTQSHTPQH
eukprot:m51a1_g4893 hypothetical protein (607) ;mRNA; f:121002-123237